ncbi:MAG: DNA repair and recombination protein RadB [Methanosaeta sp. PtaB.Bin039]|nr:MAG: DNA repair and recombination protein RadB [Methanosaeta sp. PtaB.Bin039]OPY46765.1 MAG: DNA repair and recombination protein RadB [Methanosaeta sp. PtaU1.Bin028]HOT07109.1 DNA repair and recombination protein RadB [Methanotrichaceae archaeon]HQF17053.1 DNA repair and recombination protein RadB [Methanotrichaceae archaeon]HQI91674.1 DNA repair and recombination protein RadB [Methanotrichaceae archaeon]
MNLQRLPSGCPGLDLLLGGGFEAGIITQLYGQSATGKTNIILQLAVQAVARGWRVIFIDTEGFSPERFCQIAGEGAREIASRIMVFEPLNLEQQSSAIRDAARISGEGVGLIVMDSATSLYRAVLEGDDTRAAKRTLATQMAELQEIARRNRIPVVITNQVYMDVEAGQLRPIGGTALEHICKAIICLEKTASGQREARIVKHRSRPEGEKAEFTISAAGVI